MSNKTTTAGNRYEYLELHQLHGKPSGWQKLRQQGYECLYRRPIAQASEQTPAEAFQVCANCPRPEASEQCQCPNRMTKKQTPAEAHGLEFIMPKPSWKEFAKAIEAQAKIEGIELLRLAVEQDNGATHADVLASEITDKLEAGEVVK